MRLALALFLLHSPPPPPTFPPSPERHPSPNCVPSSPVGRKQTGEAAADLMRLRPEQKPRVEVQLRRVSTRKRIPNKDQATSDYHGRTVLEARAKRSSRGKGKRWLPPTPNLHSSGPTLSLLVEPLKSCPGKQV
ncbi:unnamed protein product [Pleuronectes platessa]|uniref:Uncharacterized protein n=1 Tax=Pleuronectes platessa TaxID=8262 RepID=A0A9N7UYS0_PLEPL|nr:unnamed protein product [Pleuronectes platessa]